MAKKSFKKSYKKVSVKKGKWYHLSIFKFSIASVVVLAAVAILAGGIYNALPKGPDVLGAKTSYPSITVTLGGSCGKDGTYHLSVRWRTNYNAKNHNFAINVNNASTGNGDFTVANIKESSTNSFSKDISIKSAAGFDPKDKVNVGITDDDKIIPVGTVTNPNLGMALVSPSSSSVQYKLCSSCAYTCAATGICSAEKGKVITTGTCINSSGTGKSLGIVCCAFPTTAQSPAPTNRTNSTTLRPSTTTHTTSKPLTRPGHTNFN